MYRAVDKTLADYDAEIIYAMNQGLERGRAEGRMEGRAEGRAEGRTEGLARGELFALLKLGKTRKEIKGYAETNRIPLTIVEETLREWDNKNQ